MDFMSFSLMEIVRPDFPVATACRAAHYGTYRA